MKKIIRSYHSPVMQMTSYDRKYAASSDLDIAKNTMFAWMESYYLPTLLASFGNGAGRTLLVACAGRGFEIPFLLDQGFKITASDYSQSACDYLRATYPHIDVQQLDFEHTGLADSSYDFVLVNKGLHHLSRPMLGFLEMERIARCGFAFIENHDSLPVRFLARCLKATYEEAGNYVYRFTPREIEKTLRSLNRDCELHIRCAWLFFYGDVHRWMRLVENRPFIQFLVKAAHAIVNSLIGWCGSKMLCVVLKQQRL